VHVVMIVRQCAHAPEPGPHQLVVGRRGQVFEDRQPRPAPRRRLQRLSVGGVALMSHGASMSHDAAWSLERLYMIKNWRNIGAWSDTRCYGDWGWGSPSQVLRPGGLGKTSLTQTPKNQKMVLEKCTARSCTQQTVEHHTGEHTHAAG
jgi:hypothetical protein